MEHRSIFPLDTMGFLATAAIGCLAPFFIHDHARLFSALLAGAILVAMAHVLFKTETFRRFTKDLQPMSYGRLAASFLVVAVGMHFVLSLAFAGMMLIAQGR